jgi:hypothetical protein
MPDIVNPETHHEKSDINVRAFLWAVVAFVVFAAAMHLVLYLQFRFYRSLFRGKTNTPPMTAVARPADANVPPEPRLQPFVTRGPGGAENPPNTDTPVSDMEEMRAAEEQALQNPGWIDRQRGVVRLPIDVAKQLAVQRLQQQVVPATGAPPDATAPQPDTGETGVDAAQNVRPARPAATGATTPARRQGAHP